MPKWGRAIARRSPAMCERRLAIRVRGESRFPRTAEPRMRFAGMPIRFVNGMTLRFPAAAGFRFRTVQANRAEASATKAASGIRLE